MNTLKKINKIRLERNWSIYRLSVESGISQSTLTNMFNCETLPSITTLECLCHAFGITMAEFFTEDTGGAQSPSDRELLALYHGLSDEAQQSVVTLLRELPKRC